METTKERAARCDRATHARRSSSLPAYGSRTASITRRRRRAKRKALRAATLAAAVLLLGGISVAIFTTPAGSKQETNILPPTTTVGTYIPDTPAPAAETVDPAEPAVRYPLTDAERDVVERVVMAEAGGESFEGQMLVAQCILNAAEKRGVDPSEAVVLYSYTKSRPDPTQHVKDAVAAVFDRGETVVDEPILYFYNPALVTSDFHESQKLGAIAFVLVSVSLTDFYRVPWPVWRDMAEIYGHKYMTHAELSRYEVPATAGFIKFLHDIESETLGKEDAHDPTP